MGKKKIINKSITKGRLLNCLPMFILYFVFYIKGIMREYIAKLILCQHVNNSSLWIICVSCLFVFFFCPLIFFCCLVSLIKMYLFFLCIIFVGDTMTIILLRRYMYVFRKDYLKIIIRVMLLRNL